MQEELGFILENLENIKKEHHGDLEIYTGLWRGIKKEILISTAWSGWGKVSAARATTRLCNFSNKNKKLDFLLFTGVAGAADSKQKQWDIVVADSVLQYDIDTRPLFGEFVIPALNKEKIFPNSHLKKVLLDSLVKAKDVGILESFGLINEGLVATGDSFITDTKFLNNLKKKLQGLLAVEMEGGAFAQVAEQEGFKWILLRVISDNANDSASIDFNSFLKKYRKKSWELIETFLNSL